MKNFDEIKIGDFYEFSVTYTKENHDAFRTLSGDNSPIHINKSFALKTKFQKPIGYAGYLHTLLSRMYGEYQPGGTSVCIKQSSDYINPFYIDDCLNIRSEVTSKSQSTQFIEINTVIKNQKGKVIFKGTGTVMISFNKYETTPLFFHEQEIYSSDINKALNLSGINEGDTIFVHSDIVTFGKIKCREKGFLLGAIMDALYNSVGKSGTVSMPTFTYSFCRNEDFNIEETPSTVGVLTEFFRKQNDVQRSDHPIFSICAKGSNADKLIDTDMDSFGKKSSFANLLKLNTKIVFLGAGMHSMTFIHHIEQMYGIPYRYMKNFSGNIIKDGKTIEENASFFVRYLDKNVILDTTNIQKKLKAEGKLIEVPLGAGMIITVSAKDVYETGMKMLNEDIFSFLKEPVT